MSKQKANIYCEKCNKWYKIDFEYISELFGIRCLKCNSDRTWFGDIEGNDEDPIEMGRGGCSQK